MSDGPEFDESQHPRDDHGRFSSGPGGGLAKWAAKYSQRFAGPLAARAEKEGGFSYRPSPAKDERSPSDGFMVSHHPSEGLGHVIEIEKMAMRDPPPTVSQLREEIRTAVKTWLAKALPNVKDKDDHFLGGWFERNADGTPKALHLDVSQRFKDKDAAVKAGRERNQLAIWDVKNKAEIDTGGTGR